MNVHARAALARIDGRVDHAPMSGDLPSYLRARGAVALHCGATGARTDAARVRQEGALNVRFPRRRGDALEAVFVNVAGGVAAGDRYDIAISVTEGADLTLSTAAAEKIYRSPGDLSRIDVRLEVAGRLAWLPQETILFDQARLARTLHATMTDNATLTMAEITVLGRTAMGERVETAFLRDDWRIRRGGRHVYADILRLDGAISSLLAGRATGGGANSFATILHVAPDAEARLDEARALVDKSASPACDGAASAWDGLLTVRWLAHDARLLRGAVARFLESFRDAPLPRVWAT